MLKESIMRYVKEKTSKTDLENLDTALTAEEIAVSFQVKRNTVSYYLNQEIGKTLFKINTRPVRFFHKEEFARHFFPVSKDVYTSVNELAGERKVCGKAAGGSGKTAGGGETAREGDKDVFSNLIGSNGSLRKPIEQMKTSIFYPNTSLPIFLHGPTGAGKSHMARKIHEYAIQEKILSEKAPFVVMNCAQYANNVELLSSNLFGYVKGAFTGAYQTTKGVLEAADGGILFLDEVHRLSGESQEKLFVFLDQGIFRRMGESEGWHSAKVRMIMATTEDLHSNFLATFLRRIPIVIQIPSLKRRGEQELLQFIYHFFIEESKVLHKRIRISANVLEALLKHTYAGNIGDLENKVKFICATAYAKEQTSDVVEVHFEHLPEDVIVGIADKEDARIGSYQAVEISPDTNRDDFFQNRGTKADLGKELFEKLDSLYETFLQELRGERKTRGEGSGGSLDKREVLLEKGGENSEELLKTRFEKACRQTVYEMFDRLIYEQHTETDNIMRKYVVSSVQEAFRYVEYSYNVQFGGNSLHALIAYFWHVNQNYGAVGVKLSREFLHYILNEYQREAEIAEKILDILSCRLDILSRREDLVPLTLYLRSLLDKSVTTKRPRAVVAAHGYATASSITEVVNRILSDHVFDAVDMPIEKKVSDVVEWLKEYIQKNDVSYGILLMVDMGSLKEIYSSFETELKVPLAIINNISTQMALHAGELIQKGKELEEITEAIEHDNQIEHRIIYPREYREKAILTCCITGTGTARQLQQLIMASLPKKLGVSVISYDYDQLKKKGVVEGICQKYEILGIVGIKNPHVITEKFIPLEKLVSGEAERVMEEMLRPVADAGQIQQINDNLIYHFSMNRLLEFLTILDTEKILRHIEEAIKEYELITGGKLANSTKINLFIHVGCLTERLIRDQAITDYPDQEEFLVSHKKEIEQILSAFSVIERTYSVKIPISEIGYIFDIISEI